MKYAIIPATALAIGLLCPSAMTIYAEDPTVETAADPFGQFVDPEPFYQDFLHSIVRYPDFSALLGMNSSTVRKPGIFAGIKEASKVSDSTIPEEATFLMPCMYNTELTVKDPITGEIDRMNCPDECYQGICRTPDYFLITAYCTEKDRDGKQMHPSVIYVLDPDGTYRKTITLSRTTSNHAGGIAYDPDHRMLWVAGSAERSMNGIGYDRFLEVVDSEESYISYTYKLIVPDPLERVSFVSYSEADHLLYAGYYGSALESPRMYGYSVNEEGSYPSLVHEAECTLPENCNGAVIVESSGKKYLLSESSYGRAMHSYLYIHDLESGERIRRIVLPPMLEQLSYDSATGKVCGIFESSSRKYAEARAKPLVIVDRGFSVSLNALLKDCSTSSGMFRFGSISYTK